MTYIPLSSIVSDGNVINVVNNTIIDFEAAENIKAGDFLSLDSNSKVYKRCQPNIRCGVSFNSSWHVSPGVFMYYWAGTPKTYGLAKIVNNTIVSIATVTSDFTSPTAIQIANDTLLTYTVNTSTAPYGCKFQIIKMSPDGNSIIKSTVLSVDDPNQAASSSIYVRQGSKISNNRFLINWSRNVSTTYFHYLSDLRLDEVGNLTTKPTITSITGLNIPYCPYTSKHDDNKSFMLYQKGDNKLYYSVIDHNQDDITLIEQPVVNNSTTGLITGTGTYNHGIYKLSNNKYIQLLNNSTFFCFSFDGTVLTYLYKPASLGTAMSTGNLYTTYIGNDIMVFYTSVTVNSNQCGQANFYKWTDTSCDLIGPLNIVLPTSGFEYFGFENCKMYGTVYLNGNYRFYVNGASFIEPYIGVAMTNANIGEIVKVVISGIYKCDNAVYNVGKYYNHYRLIMASLWAAPTTTPTLSPEVSTAYSTRVIDIKKSDFYS